MEKKGAESISIVILVFMTLALIGIALYSFVTSARIEGRIIDARALDFIYAKENEIRFYAEDAEERALVRAYEENWDEENFKNVFVKNFKEEVGKYTFSDNILNGFKERIAHGDFNVIEKDDFEIEFEGEIVGSIVNRNKKIWEWSFNEDLMGVVYRPKISVNLDYERIGLHNPEDIKEALDECKNEEIKKCLEDKLRNFDIEIKEMEKSIKMMSKRKFTINGVLRSVVINAKI